MFSVRSGYLPEVARLLGEIIRSIEESRVCLQPQRRAHLL